MPIERKFTALKDLKMLDEGSGVIEGYRSVYGVIDEGGDIVVKGAFADTLSDYLLSGFTAQSHDWDFDKAVGFPVEAHEDDNGWWVKSQFHSTPDAQNVRTKAKERMDAGKTVGFSFGYAPKLFSYIEAKDYEAELPKYVNATALPAMLEKAQKFNRIRVLKAVEAIEDSIVTAPMNKRAMATAVKSDDAAIGAKGALAEEMAQNTPSFWQIESAYCRVVRKVAETAKDSAVTGVTIDWRARIADVTSEFASQLGPIAINQVEEYLDSTDDEFYLKGITALESFESFDQAALASLKMFIENMQRNQAWRQKEGRILSSTNRATVQKCKDSLMELMGDLDALLTMSEPKPKDMEKSTDALRTQLARARSKALAALAS